MSQEKVDRYKQDKANRKQIMRKQKMKGVVRKAVVSLAALALVGWLGYSAWETYNSNGVRPVAEVNYDSVSNYLNTLSASETKKKNGYSRDFYLPYRKNIKNKIMADTTYGVQGFPCTPYVCLGLKRAIPGAFLGLKKIKRGLKKGGLWFKMESSGNKWWKVV